MIGWDFVIGNILDCSFSITTLMLPPHHLTLSAVKLQGKLKGTSVFENPSSDLTDHSFSASDLSPQSHSLPQPLWLQHCLTSAHHPISHNSESTPHIQF